MIRQGSIGQGVQFTSLHILLQLLVPRGRIKGGKPLPELGQLLSRQTTDLLFKLLDLGHNQEYKGSLIVRLTDRASAAARRVVVHEHNYSLTVGAVSCKRMLGGGISLAIR